jgi:hypothetical protein
MYYKTIFTLKPGMEYLAIKNYLVRLHFSGALQCDLRVSPPGNVIIKTPFRQTTGEKGVFKNFNQVGMSI